MENISDGDCMHAKIVCKDFMICKEYHNLFVQSDTFLLADVFENFRNLCVKKYKLDSAKFLSALGLAWQTL